MSKILNGQGNSVPSKRFYFLPLLLSLVKHYRIYLKGILGNVLYIYCDQNFIKNNGRNKKRCALGSFAQMIHIPVAINFGKFECLTACITISTAIYLCSLNTTTVNYCVRIQKKLDNDYLTLAVSTE